MSKQALIVDDVKMNRILLNSYLTYKRFIVDEAEDGLAAYKKIKLKKYDIVFTDIDMPNMNGLELLARVQKDPNLKGTPFVMLTTHDTQEIIEKARKLGALYHLVKPYSELKIDTAMKAVGLI